MNRPLTEVSEEIALSYDTLYHAAKRKHFNTVVVDGKICVVYDDVFAQYLKDKRSEPAPPPTMQELMDAISTLDEKLDRVLAQTQPKPGLFRRNL